MIITALHTFQGKIDLSANQILQDLSEMEALPFQLFMEPGQVAVVDDKFYVLRSIQSAEANGFINVVIDPIVRRFIQLSDVPNSYVGHRDKLVKVRNDETGLEFGLRLTVGNVEPVNPSVGDLWVDTT